MILKLLSQLTYALYCLISYHKNICKAPQAEHCSRILIVCQTFSILAQPHHLRIKPWSPYRLLFPHILVASVPVVSRRKHPYCLIQLVSRLKIFCSLDQANFNLHQPQRLKRLALLIVNAFAIFLPPVPVTTQTTAYGV